MLFRSLGQAFLELLAVVVGGGFLDLGADLVAAADDVGLFAGALDKLRTSNPDQKAGIDIIRRALQAPVRQIVDNAGDDGSVVVGKLLESKDTNFGYDAQKGEYVNMIKAGIIDPTKVVRTALQDAASVAGLLITTEAMIADKVEKNPAPMPGGGGMDY